MPSLCRRAELLTLQIIVFTLPLAFFPWSTQVFEMPKFVVFIAITVVFCMLAFVVHSSRQPLSSVRILATLFLLSASMSVFVGMNTQTSLFGSVDRHMGFVTFLGYGVLALSVARLRMTEREQVRTFIVPMILIGCIEAFIACVQYVRPEFPFPFLNVAELGGRSFGTFGHPNFLGSFLIVPFIFCLTQWLSSRKHSLLFVSAMMLLAVGIVVTGSRAALLGITAGTAMIVVLHRHDPQLRRKLLTVILLLAALVLLTVTRRGSGGSDSMSIRILVWSAVPRAIVAHPIFGVGFDNFWSAFKPVEPASLAERFPATVIDRSHNIELDLLVETGIAGFASALALAVAVVRSACRRSFTLMRTAYAATILGLIVAWQFGFPTITDGAFFSVCLGLLMAQPSKSSPVPRA